MTYLMPVLLFMVVPSMRQRRNHACSLLWHLVLCLPPLQTIFFTLAVTFFLLCGGNYSTQCKTAAGYVGFFCGSSAIYTAIAELYQVGDVFEMQVSIDRE
jgi:succinate-acetate transporter protein